MDGRHRLYGDLAHLWPLMSPPDHYKEEARYWLRELRARLAPGRRRILDLGTGGGHHLHQLTAEFDATAVDLSEAMLAHSRRLNPGVAHHVGDMRTVRLGETFDAVLSPRRHLLHDDGGRPDGRLRDGARPPPPRRPADRRARRLHRHVRSAPGRLPGPTATPIPSSPTSSTRRTSTSTTRPSRPRTYSSSRRAANCGWRWTTTRPAYSPSPRGNAC